MEDLIRLVSECFARHGIEPIPARDPKPGESAPTLAAAPLLEALPEHNYRDHNHGESAPPDPASLRRAETPGHGTAAL